VVFVRAIDLRDRDISVTWDQATHQYRCDRAAISSQALEKSWVAL
jgi:hypothetical protein